MFSQKYANDFKSKVKSNVERKLNFAKLYLLYKEYDTAKTYAVEFLKQREDSAAGHKVLAQIYEAVGETEKALKSYQKSLEYDNTQEDVLLKICKLLVSHPCDSDTLRFWIEKAEKCFPKKDIVSELKSCVEYAERCNGDENDPSFGDNTLNSNYSYYSTPLSERFMNQSMKTTSKHLPQSNVNVDRMEGKLDLISKKQEELLKRICDQQDLLLQSNNSILDAIKEGNNCFSNLKVTMDKMHSTLQEIYLLKNISFSKKQNFNNSGICVSYGDPVESNPTPPRRDNVNGEQDKNNFVFPTNNVSTFTDVGKIQIAPDSTNKPKEFQWSVPTSTSSTDVNNSFALKFKNCNIEEDFQKAIHGAKGFHDSSENTGQPFNDMFRHSEESWSCVNDSDDNVGSDGQSYEKAEVTDHSNVSFNTAIGNDMFSESNRTASSIYPKSLFPPTTIGSFITQSENSYKPSPFSFGENSGGIGQTETRSLSDIVKTQQQGWQCNVCYVVNNASSVNCAACEEPKPGVGNAVSKSNDKAECFKFSGPFSSASGFESTQTSTQSVFKFDIPSTGNTAEGTGFRFGEGAVFSNSKFQDNKASTPTKPFSFSEALKNSQSAFQFGSSQDFSFKFGGVSPQNTKSPKQPQDAPQSPEDYHESPEHSNDDSMHFKPLIPLPPKIEVKTGEEDEVVLLSERAKLYRFISNEWKERGVGDLKILHDTVHHRIRLLMRRDQVLKVCLNHYITRDLELTPKGSSNDEGGVKSFQWSAVDYSDGAANLEVFAIKFKNSSVAENFKKTFESSKALLSNVPKETSDLEIIYEKTPEDAEVLEKVRILKLPLNFYDYENRQPCPGCRGCKDEMPALVCEKGSVESNENDDNNVASSNLFSAAMAEQGTTATTWASTAPQSAPSWFSNKPVPVFGSQADDEEANDNNDGKDFKPVIPLPDLVDVKTGEEDESPIFSQRAKLYRYDAPTKQWKERGVGEFKILKHNSKNRYRLLLRRDQVFKIACNHYIETSINFTPMQNSENAVCWSAIDYSEEFAVSEQLAVKFKNKSILAEFLDAINAAKTQLEEAGSNFTTEA